jgi:hypothetical protein
MDSTPSTVTSFTLIVNTDENGNITSIVVQQTNTTQDGFMKNTSSAPILTPSDQKSLQQVVSDVFSSVTGTVTQAGTLPINNV